MLEITKTAIAAVFIALAMLPSTLAWGVAYESTDVTMQQGDTKQFYTSLQNVVDNITYAVNATIISGTEVASLTSNQFTLPPNTTKLPVYITIQIPDQNAAESYVIQIKYSLSDIGNSEQVGLIAEKIVKIRVTVTQPEPEPPPPPPEPDPAPSSGSSGSYGGSYTKPPSTNQTPDEPPQEQPDPIITYPPLETVDNGDDPTTQIPIPSVSAAESSVIVSPTRVPVEWIAVIGIAALIVYMLLPPKQESHSPQQVSPYAHN